MKDLEYYTNLNYKIEIIKDEEGGGYVFSHPELKGCLTCSEELEKGIKKLEDAKKQWIIAALDSAYIIPVPGVDDYSSQFNLSIPRSLYKNLIEKSKEEGISLAQYCLYLLSKYS